MKKKILIVEDDSFLRIVIAKKLISSGYDITWAANGEDGITMAKKMRPDLILLDLILPDIDGFGVLSKVKEDEKIKYIPVIILSNLSQEEYIQKAHDLGAIDYLTKASLTPSEIIEKIEKIIT